MMQIFSCVALTFGSESKNTKQGWVLVVRARGVHAGAGGWIWGRGEGKEMEKGLMEERWGGTRNATG